MNQLVKKEFKLCLHPLAIAMLITPLMVKLLGYPYLVTFFYMTFGIFMISQQGRENNDITYSLNLPVTRRDIVKSKTLFFCILELVQLALVGVVSLTSNGIVNVTSMDANIALLGEGFLFFGIFNFIFLSILYKNVIKVGKGYFFASIVSAILVIADPISVHMIPFFRDVLDTPDPMNIGAKLIFLVISILVYLLLTYFAVKISVAEFEKQDIR